MQWIALSLLLIPIALSESVGSQKKVDPAYARINAPPPDKSTWDDPTRKHLGTPSVKQQCTNKPCPPCSTAPMHFSRLVRRILMLFGNAAKKSELASDGAPDESWEIFLRMELSAKDGRLLQSFLSHEAVEGKLEKTDFYDVSGALERIFQPTNRVQCLPRNGDPPLGEHNFFTPSFLTMAHYVVGRLFAILNGMVSLLWTGAFNHATFEAFLVISCLLSFYLMLKALAACWPWYHIAMLALFLGFFISYFWMYGQLYEEELLRRSDILDAGVSLDCAEKVSAAEQKWDQTWKSYVVSLMPTWSSPARQSGSKECREYYDALYKNPLRKINPAFVFIKLASLILFEPMEKFGVNYGKFQAAVWQNSSWGSALAASIGGTVVLIFIILVLCGYGFHLPFYLGSFTPNRDPVSGPPPMSRQVSEAVSLQAVAASSSFEAAVISSNPALTIQQMEEERQVEEFRRELRRAKSHVDGTRATLLRQRSDTSSAPAIAGRPGRSVSVPQVAQDRGRDLVNGTSANAVQPPSVLVRHRRVHRRRHVELDVNVDEVVRDIEPPVAAGGRSQPVDPQMREFIKEVITDCLERQKRQIASRTSSNDIPEVDILRETDDDDDDSVVVVDRGDLEDDDADSSTSEGNKENKSDCSACRAKESPEITKEPDKQGGEV